MTLEMMKTKTKDITYLGMYIVTQKCVEFVEVTLESLLKLVELS